MTTTTRSTLRVPLGSSDLQVFPLNLGGNVFGWTADEQTSFAVLDAHREAGGNFVDTADVYSAWAPGNSGGDSETIIGRWIAERGRGDLVVATKVGAWEQLPGLAADTVRRAVDGSRERLGVDTIDLYYAHRDDEDRPVDEIARTFSALVDDGAIRAIGASNFSAERLQGWLDAAEREGLHAPVAVQPRYNLVDRSIERDLLPLTRRAGLAVLPYSALASGFLTGKYRDGVTVDSARAAGASALLDDRGRRVLDALDDVARATGTTPTTVSLAWLRQQDGVTAPIASARTVEQLPDVLASATLELTAGQLAQLTAASQTSG